MAITTAGMDAMLGILDATVYLETHDGAPGADGSTNRVIATPLPSIAFGAAATDGGTGRERKGPSATAITLTDPGAGTYQAWSIWNSDNSGTGDCLWIIPFGTNRTLSAGDDLRCPVDGVTCGVAPAP